MSYHTTGSPRNYYVKEVLGEMSIEVGFESLTELQEYLNSKDRLIRDSDRYVSDTPTAYCATCGHDHPVDDRDYPGEPELGAPMVPDKRTPDWKERVIAERSELGEKIIKLASFIENSAFKKVSQNQQDLLKRQLTVMQEYWHILLVRGSNE